MKLSHFLASLLVLPLLLGAGGCNGTTGEAAPQDPVALAQSLGEFRIEPGFYWDPGGRGFTMYISPKDREAQVGGALTNGYPLEPPGPACNGCTHFGGVGRDWVRFLSWARPYFLSGPEYFPLMFALPEGEFRAEFYLRMWGRWYLVVERARMGLNPEGNRFLMEPLPAEAYPLPELPEIFPYDKKPPMLVVAVCAQPGSRYPQDPWGTFLSRPYIAFTGLNAIQRIYYDAGELKGNGYLEPLPPRHGYLYCPYCPSIGGVPLDRDYYYDIFVRFVNTEPRQARAYGTWWRLYNPRPLKVRRNPDGSFTCENFDRENLRTYEGPFDEAHLRTHYGIDPANPPRRYLGPR